MTEGNKDKKGQLLEAPSVPGGRAVGPPCPRPPPGPRAEPSLLQMLTLLLAFVPGDTGLLHLGRDAQHHGHGQHIRDVHHEPLLQAQPAQASAPWGAPPRPLHTGSCTGRGAPERPGTPWQECQAGGGLGTKSLLDTGPGQATGRRVSRQSDKVRPLKKPPHGPVSLPEWQLRSSTICLNFSFVTSRSKTYPETLPALQAVCATLSPWVHWLCCLPLSPPLHPADFLGVPGQPLPHPSRDGAHAALGD